jgi:transcriptional regulator with XRE-family HTH domain
MLIGARLRMLRERRNLSQGDVYHRTGLMSCYLSRVENGYTVPSVETLEKLARALDIPLYYLFYEGERPPAALSRYISRKDDPGAWSDSRKDTRFINRLSAYLARTDRAHTELLLQMAEMMASPARHPKKRK